MFKRLYQLIFASEPFELKINLPLNQALAMLDSEVTKLALFKATTPDQLVGTIKADEFKLWRGGPTDKNSFKPVFSGHLKTEASHTLLSGSFRLNRSVQVFITVWFAFIALWLILAIAAVIEKPAENWYLPLLALFMFGFGVGVLKVAKSFSSNDQPWIKEKLVDIFKTVKQ